MSRNPGYSMIVVLTLALGIGVTTAIFTVVQGVLLQPLPYRDPDRIVLLSDSKPEAGVPRTAVSYLNYQDYRNNEGFETMTAMLRASFNLTGDGNPERFSGSPVSADYFQVLGTPKMTLGRGFLPGEDQPGGEPVVVLSHAVWSRRFGSDPEILGRALNLNATSRIVVGIAPPAFDHTDLWTPMTADYSTTRRDLHFLRVLARLAPGVTLDQARAEMNSIAAGLEQKYPETNSGWTVRVDRLHDTLVERVRSSLLILLLAVGLVMLVACSNLASLTLSRLAARQREVAVRTALGVSRWRLVRQLLSESVLLSLIGGALGLTLAGWGTRILISLSADSIPLTDDLGINTSILLFTLLLTLTLALLFGLVPALQASQRSPQQALREGGRGQIGRNRGILRGGLVLMQVALALVLLVGAGLLIRSFQNMQEVDLGFDPKDVLTLRLSLPQNQYPDDGDAASFFHQLEERLSAIPGTENAGIIYPLPLSGGGFSLQANLQGYPPDDSRSPAAVRAVTPGYFETARIPLESGRHFTERDGLEAQQVAIVNEIAARSYWPDEDPIGKVFTFDDLNSEIVNWWTVVGVVGDVRYGGVSIESGPEVYRPMAQRPRWSASVAVRTTGDPKTFLGSVRAAIWELDSNLPVYNVKLLEEIVSGSVARTRFNTLLLGLFAALALVLTSLGVYGTVNYAVSGRLREIGIRSALGANRTDALRLVLRQGMWPVIVGLAVGLVAAFAATRVLAGLVFGISAADPATLLSAPIVLTLVALLACLVPALRATRVDPATVLRAE